MSKLIDQLLSLQADAHTLWIRFHNYHWNIKGFEFFAIHEYTEKAYDDIAKLFDDVAERAIQLGGRALVCSRALAEKSNIAKIQKDNFNAVDVLEGLKKDYEYLLAEFKKLDKLANEADDTTTSTLAQDYIAKYEKSIWMLNSSLNKA